jgi:6-phosphogluconate dehydrogenase
LATTEAVNKDDVMIDFARCVEAHVTGIAVLEESSAINIALRDSDKRCFTLAAKGIDRFIATEFRERNIVDRVTLWDSSSELGEYRDSLSMLVSGSNDVAEDAAWQALIDKEVAAIKQKEKILVEVEAVYGVSILLLAKEVALIDG